MQELYEYQIEVQGQMDQGVFNSTSPIQVHVDRVEDMTTLLTVHADQSGLVGLIRHLHHQGFVLLSFSRD